MVQKIVFPTGGIFIGIKRKGDANTNEILQKALIKRGFSIEAGGKYCKGKKVFVWEVDDDFVNMLYAEEWNFKLKFVVYMEIGYIFQRFPLKDPRVKTKAKHMREKLLKKLKKLKERRDKEVC